ncbi:MAG: hypothetical protein R2701_12045 [Acidimicrobiales bacterium]
MTGDTQGGATMDQSTARTAEPTPRPAMSLAIVPMLLLLSSCKISDVTDPIIKVVDPIVTPIEELFGLDDGEVATPQFELVNGITIQVVLRFDDVKAGIPVTVNLRCAGGTSLSQTVILEDSGSVALGATTFTPGWPAGTDCVVGQEIVKGVEAVKTTIEWLDSNDVQATFDAA